YGKNGDRIAKLYVRNGNYYYRAKHPLAGGDWWLLLGPTWLHKMDDDFEHLRAEVAATKEFVDAPECAELLVPCLPDAADPTYPPLLSDEELDQHFARVRSIIDELEALAKEDYEDETPGSDARRAFFSIVRLQIELTDLVGMCVNAAANNTVGGSSPADDDFAGYWNAFDNLVEA